MSDYFKDLRWTCHVCGDERPDAVISVMKFKQNFGEGLTVEQNVRYCNDRPACAAGAPGAVFLPDVEDD